MADSTGPKPIPHSVTLAAEKARSERLQRLKTTLDQRLTNPIAAIDALLAELAEGAAHPDLWEGLHAAAIRDKLEDQLADAYVRSLAGPRMKRLPADAQAIALMHAADYFQGVRGDVEGSADLLRRVLSLVPGHPEAFGRLERWLEKLLDARGLLELYANAASSPPRPANVLAAQATHRLYQIAGKESLSEEACHGLVDLVPHHPQLLEALESHCRATKRPALGCALLERALTVGNAPPPLVVQRRHRLVELYMSETDTPESAMPHVEKLLENDPTDAKARKAAEKLLSVRQVASRAAAALAAARRRRPSG